MLEPQPVELLEDRDTRLGDLETHHPATGTAHPPHLAERLGDVGDVTDAEAHGACVETGDGTASRAFAAGVGCSSSSAVGKGKLQYIAQAELHIQLIPPTLLPSHIEHLLRNIHRHHPTLRAHRSLQREGEVAGPAAYVEDLRSRTHSGEQHPELAPAMVQTGGHQVVQTVVGPRDAVEHLPYLAGLR